LRVGGAFRLPAQGSAALPASDAQTLDNLARAALEQGDDRRATVLFREGLGLARELNDRATLPLTLEDMVDVVTPDHR